LPVRIVVMATVVMTAAVVTGTAAVLDNCLGVRSRAVGGPFTTWLNPEQVAGHGHPSGSGRRLAGPCEPLAWAG
jgi:hypothetical protein